MGVVQDELVSHSFLADPAQAEVRNRWRRYLRGLPRSLARAAAASTGRSSIRAELADIRAPTLVLSGSEDRPISPAHARHKAEAIPSAVIRPILDVGHAVMLERPDIVNRALLTHVPPSSAAA